MPAPTVPRALDGLDFQGKSRSYTTLPRSAGRWPSCKRCGSTLYPERFESSGVCTIGGFGGCRCLKPLPNVCEGRRGIHGDPG